LKINHCSGVSSKVQPDIAAIASGHAAFLTATPESLGPGATAACEIAADMACPAAAPDFSRRTT
jgi:hypothetical protein